MSGTLSGAWRTSGNQLSPARRWHWSCPDDFLFRPRAQRASGHMRKGWFAMSTTTKHPSHESHHQAAAHHAAAAHHHLQAAHHHQQGEHDQAKAHATAAQEHSQQAHQHTQTAHQQSHK